MKFTKLTLAAFAVVLILAIAIRQSVALAAVCAFLFAGAWLMPRPQLGTATLILPILTGKIIEAFKVKTRALSYISTDFGKSANGDFAPPVKFDQEIISQLALVPTISDHTPGEDLTTGAQNAKDLVTDVRVKINRAKKCVLKLPTADAVKLELDGAFQSALAEGAKALGRAVVVDVLAEITPDNFSQKIVETVAGADLDTLEEGRIAMNGLGTLEPRYGLGGSRFVSNIGKDTRVASRDYKGQMVGSEAYQVLHAVGGLQELAEHPGFPSGDTTIGTFAGEADDEVLTVNVAHGLQVGDRVRVSGGSLPTGLAAATTYFVQAIPTATTLKLSATSGGAAINLTADGTGSILNYGGLNGFFFEKRAIHLAVRQLIDNLKLAESLGIPVPIAHHDETDPETGLTFHAFMWIDVKTHDIYVAFTVAYGIKAGRDMATDSTNTDAGALAAGSGLDYAGVRVTET